MWLAAMTDIYLDVRILRDFSEREVF